MSNVLKFTYTKKRGDEIFKVVNCPISYVTLHLTKMCSQYLSVLLLAYLTGPSDVVHFGTLDTPSVSVFGFPLTCQSLVMVIA